MILHYDEHTATVHDRQHAGNVRCGKNAGRKNRTDDPAQVTCPSCLACLTR